jgi:hypothetical protein
MPTVTTAVILDAGPNRGAPIWKPGQSGNPAGVSKIRLELLSACQVGQTPERVRQVIDAMWSKAVEDGDVPAATLYLRYVVGPVEEDARLEELAERKLREAVERAKAALESRRAAAVDVEVTP